jgi:hypothetical protein
MENYYKSSPKKKTDFLKKPVCQQSETSSLVDEVFSC